MELKVTMYNINPDYNEELKKVREDERELGREEGRDEGLEEGKEIGAKALLKIFYDMRIPKEVAISELQTNFPSLSIRQRNLLCLQRKEKIYEDSGYRI